MDKLERIFDLQRNFERDFLKFNGIDLDNISSEDKQKMTKEWILCLIKESTEILDEINWKQHLLSKKDVIEDNLIEEMIDALKYWMAICTIWGIDANKVFSEFERKSIVVSQKFEQEKLLKIAKESKDTRVCAIDIDGVLYSWPEAYVDWVHNNKYYPDLKISTFEELEDLNIKARLKQEYRLSGIKAIAKPNEYASELTQFLKDNKYTIILITSRPYWKYQRIYADTLQWLNTYNIKFDAIIWEEKKEEYLIKNFPDIQFVIEDDVSNANKLIRAGFKVFLKKTLYNKDVKTKAMKFEHLQDLPSCFNGWEITSIDSEVFDAYKK